MASLAQAANGLDPAEDILNPFAFLLANQIARMTSRALVDNAGLLAREMGRYLVVAQLLNKLLAVVSFVGKVMRCSPRISSTIASFTVCAEQRIVREG